jgi:hypothetical protein
MSIFEMDGHLRVISLLQQYGRGEQWTPEELARVQQR